MTVAEWMHAATNKSRKRQTRESVWVFCSLSAQQYDETRGRARFNIVACIILAHISNWRQSSANGRERTPKQPNTSKQIPNKKTSHMLKHQHILLPKGPGG